MPFAVEPSTEISHRTDFSILANARGYKDAVEVGVDQGIFAKDFLSRWHGHWLYLVDPYRDAAEFPVDRSADMAVAIQALTPFHGRFRFVRHPSPAAIPFVRSLITPEFVYIDGSHVYEDVKADLEAWWEALAPHGCLAGHDWDTEHPGVTRAVEEFAANRGLIVRTTHETTSPASWYIYKTEPSTLFHRLFRSGESPNPYVAG